MTQKQLIRVAKLEMEQWKDLPRGLVLAILFAFIHRATTGNTIEETFFPAKGQELDWEI